MSGFLIIKQIKGDPGVGIEFGRNHEDILPYVIGCVLREAGPILWTADCQITRILLQKIHSNEFGIEPEDIYITSGWTKDWDKSHRVIVVVAQDCYVYQANQKISFKDMADWSMGKAPIWLAGEDINDLWDNRVAYKKWKNLTKQWGEG